MPAYRSVSLDELLHESDVISIHCPLTEATHDLIGYEQLCRMKKEAILINAGRGGIVNEAALAQALDENRIAAAALDVLEKEPPEISNPLFRIKNPEKLLITPHIAWASRESRERLMDGIITNITEYCVENPVRMTCQVRICKTFFIFYAKKRFRLKKKSSPYWPCPDVLHCIDRR